MKLINFAIICLIVIILVGSFFMINYYFANQEKKCVANPLSYGAKELENKYGYSFIGSGMFLVPMGYQSPVIVFNSTSLSIQNNP